MKMRGPGNASGRKPKNLMKTIKRILSYMTESKFLLYLVIILVLICCVTRVIGTYLLKPVINDCIIPLIGANNSFDDFLPLIKMLTIMSIVYLLSVVSAYMYSRIILSISNKSLNTIRKDLFNSMQDLSISYFDKSTHGELMSRFTNDVDMLREALNSGVSTLITSVLTLAGTFVMMVVLSPILTILLIFMVYVMFVISKSVGKKSMTYFRKQQQSVGAVNGYIEELIEGQKVVKIFTHEKETVEEFDKLNEELRKSSTSANIYGSVLMPIIGNMSHFNYALTAICGSFLAIKGFLDIGSIASFLQYTKSFTQPIAQMSQQMNAILGALAGAERIFCIIDEKKEYNNEQIEYCFDKNKAYWVTPNKKIEIKGNVTFENVKFGYNEDKIIIHDLTLTANKGQTIALVGSTGAGKTTITNLLNRFYDIQGGKILIDGINIKDIKKDDLRKSMSMVLQDTHLFTGTVMENIRYGRLSATDEDVINAAKLANADSFIRHLPEGYNTLLIADGENLSQGQRQLLNIARAAVANPQILILDEATSSIDTRTEKLIEKGLNKLMYGRTVFIIAHRLSTVRNSDVITVLENGRVIESGNHDNLLEKKGKYYQLYTGQFELD